jgi:hypothetical protein
MRVLDLPPLGAVDDLREIEPGNRLYLVSRYHLDPFVYLWVPPEGVQTSGTGRSELMTLLGWNRNRWDSVTFHVYSLNLHSVSNPVRNAYNDAYVFRNLDKAKVYAEYCDSHPTRQKWLVLEDGSHQRVDVDPFGDRASGDRKPPCYS